MSTLTLQPSKDNFLSEALPDLNLGTRTFLDFRDKVDYIERIILSFDISSLPAGAVISSATLSLFYDYWAANPSDIDPVGETVWVYKCTKADWVEDEATWNIYKTGSNWTAAGGDYVTSNPSGDSLVMPSSQDVWLEFDAKTIVEDAVDNSIDAHFLVKFETEGLASDVCHSVICRSGEEETEAQRPKLVIVYSTVYPSDAQTRVTSLIHRYDRGTYTLEVNLGEVIADFGLPEIVTKPKPAVEKSPEEKLGEEIEHFEAISRELTVPEEPKAPVGLTPYAEKIIEERAPAIEVLQQRAKAVELGVTAPSARTVEIFMKEPEKIAILQEIEKLSRSATASGITPYARDVLQRAIKRKQDELVALYEK